MSKKNKTRNDSVQSVDSPGHGPAQLSADSTQNGAASNSSSNNTGNSNNKRRK